LFAQRVGPESRSQSPLSGKDKKELWFSLLEAARHGMGSDQTQDDCHLLVLAMSVLLTCVPLHSSLSGIHKHTLASLVSSANRSQPPRGTYSERDLLRDVLSAGIPLPCRPSFHGVLGWLGEQQMGTAGHKGTWKILQLRAILRGGR
jgi:hypothetical protein